MSTLAFHLRIPALAVAASRRPFWRVWLEEGWYRQASILWVYIYCSATNMQSVESITGILIVPMVICKLHTQTVVAVVSTLMKSNSSMYLYAPDDANNDNNGGGDTVAVQELAIGVLVCCLV
jgi:hypothetical protein